MSSPQSSLNRSPLAGIHILLAEDSFDQGRLYLTFLKQAGADVTLECNGQSAVEYVRRSPSKIDVVVMDFQMPEMDGLEATQKLHDINFPGAIVAITAHDSTDLRERWLRTGCDAYLKKPIPQQLLIETIQQHLKTTGQELPVQSCVKS